MISLQIPRAAIAAFFLVVLAACGGGGGEGSNAGNTSDSSADSALVITPSGLIYGASSMTYVQGQAIKPNAPSTSGGPITQYSVMPALPAGLSLDTASGVISGTPAAVTAAAFYTVTGSNARGDATARLQIEVRPALQAPESLTYAATQVSLPVGGTIVPMTPSATGAQITQYSVLPPLPAGLNLDPLTGVISGTPKAATASFLYTITGSNSAGSVTTQLTLQIRAGVLPPSTLSYGNSNPVYQVNQAIVANEPVVSGGQVTQYSVAPNLPAGLSLNAVTGAITGTPTEQVVPAVTYRITGSNVAGSISVGVSITVKPASSTWMPGGSMGMQDKNVVATLLQNGNVLIAGGDSSGDASTSAAVLFNAADRAWSSTASMGTPRSGHTMTQLEDGRVLVVSGGNRTGMISLVTPTAELYDPATGIWSPTGALDGGGYSSHSATLLRNGKVLVVGNDSFPAVRLYDPATGRWSATGSTNRGRTNHTATLLPDGRVLVAGGATSFCEIYDPASGQWSFTGSMSTNRTRHTATLLPNSNVLVAGGYAGDPAEPIALSSAELYDPTSGTWSSVGNMSAPRTGHSMTVLNDGKVLVAGGYDYTNYLSSAELYDPARGIWAPAAGMSIARAYHSATLLPSGDVLVAGGAGKNGAIYSSSELYVP